MRNFIFLISFLFISGLQAKETVSITSSFDEGYLIWKSNNSNIRYWIDGRIMLDSWYIDNSKKNNYFAGGIGTRRARFAIKSQLHGHFYGEFDFDLANNDIEIKDMWIAYKLHSNSIFKIGNHKIPFSLEEVTTSRWTTFMERASVNEFSPGRKMGVSFLHFSSNYFIHIGLFGDAPSLGAEDKSEIHDVNAITLKDYETSRSRKESFSFGTRIAVRPYTDTNSVFHLGGSYFYHRLPKDGSEDQTIKYKVGPNLDGMNIVPLDTDDMAGISLEQGMGSEILYLKNQWMIQAELIATQLTTTSDSKYFFSGGYIFYSYFFTDDKRTYSMSDGELGPVCPSNKESGAWELAVRYDYLNLTDRNHGVFGGGGSHFTIGVNWYVNENVKLMINGIYAHYDQYATGPKKVYKNDDPTDDLKVDDLEGSDRLKIVAIRFQYMF